MHITNELVSSAVSGNFSLGIATWCYFDEFHAPLNDALTASYFVTISQRRKTSKWRTEI